MGSDVIPHRHAVAVHLDLQRSRHTPEPNVPRPRPTRRSRTAPDGNTFATTTTPDKRAAWFGSPAGASAASGIPVEPYPGVLDHVMGNGVEAVYGAGVGGGSLVFGSFTPVPRRQDFEHIFPAAADYAQLAQTYFPRAKAGLGVSPLPADVLAHPEYVGARSWLKVIERYGASPHFFDFAIDWDIVRDELAGRATPSVTAGELSYGVNSGAKKSLDRSYLLAAERTGNVTVRPMHEVFDIRPRSRRAGFVVTARVLDEQGRTVRTVTTEADHLFMAAGSFHTTRLLVEARAQGRLPRLSPRIGDGFGVNGDFLTIRANPREDFGAVQGGPGYARIYEDDLPGGPVSMVYQATPLPAPLGKAATTHLVQAHTDERGTIDYDHRTRRAQLNYPTPPTATISTAGASPSSSVSTNAPRAVSASPPTEPTCRLARSDSVPRVPITGSAASSWVPRPTLTAESGATTTCGSSTVPSYPGQSAW